MLDSSLDFCEETDDEVKDMLRMRRKGRRANMADTMEDASEEFATTAMSSMRVSSLGMSKSNYNEGEAMNRLGSSGTLDRLRR